MESRLKSGFIFSISFLQELKTKVEKKEKETKSKRKNLLKGMFIRFMGFQLFTFQKCFPKNQIIDINFQQIKPIVQCSNINGSNNISLIFTGRG